MTDATTRYQNGHWESLSSLETARSHCPIVAMNGKIYGFGGGGPQFLSLNSVIIFDPTDQSWSKGCDMPTSRSGAIAKIIGDKVYVIGGMAKDLDGHGFAFLDVVEIYDPATDSWTTGPAMLKPHDYPAGTLLGDHIYILAGHHPDATTGGPQTDPGFEFCERLDLKTGTWEQISDIPTPRFALDAVTHDDKILTLAGVAFTPEGFNNFDHTEVYDPANNSWSKGSITLPWTAAGLGAIVHHDHLFIMGGYSGDGISDHTACYDFAAKQWQILAPIPQTLAAMGVARIDDTIYILGGWTDNKRAPQDCVYRFQLGS